MDRGHTEKYCGRIFSKDELEQITEIVGSCRGLTRTELANTVCELFTWKRPTERLKTVECRQFLEHLESKGILSLPQCKNRQHRGTNTKTLKTERGNFQPPITGKASQFFPLRLTRITTKEQRDLWYEYIDRYHYLGYQLPFGAQLRYFIETSEGSILGCFQFSSPAWKMAPRDKWIGWSDEQRKRNLQKIINNSRFLILPWIQVKNLASSVLSLAARQVPKDWQACYNYQPVLLETLVHKSRFKGTCYRAANGCTWAQPQAGAGWTGTADAKAWTLKRFTSIRLPSDFGKSSLRRGRSWGLHVLLIPRLMIGSNFEK